MNTSTFLFTCKVLILFLLGYITAAPAKVDNALYRSFETKETVSVFLNMREGTKALLDSVSSQKFSSREERINTVVNALKLHSGRTQKNIQNFLNENSISHKIFWVSNQVYIPEATLSLVNQLSNLFPEIDEIIEEGVSYIEEPKVSKITELPGDSARETQWGISKIQADRVWGTAGHTGVGVVVGVIDTGVRSTHQDLIINYRTPYGWRDPSNTDANSTPVDGNGHGTHCTGTIIGSNGIGVAPGARWIACRGCTSIFCLNSDLILCGQWMLCPTLPDGTQEDCSKAAHLVSNSWAGGAGNNFYDPVVNAWKAANIIPVFAQGNYGPSCSSASAPGDSDVIGVGATDSVDNLANFSGKGPSYYGTLKPDISAPGVDVYSAYANSDNGYATLSGTSMATPHVAGAVALILSRRPNMTYTEVKQTLFGGVDTDVLTECTLNCGGIPGDIYPNNCYGHGRLNVYNSVVNIQ